MTSDYSSIPDYTMKAIKEYANNRVPPGGFLTAILSNNLSESFGRADHNNLQAIHAIVSYCIWEIPSTCWGSSDKVRQWLKPEERGR